MENRPFGRTGLQVSAIGFGCWEIGGGYGRIEESRRRRDVILVTKFGIGYRDKPTLRDASRARVMASIKKSLGWSIAESDLAEIDAIFARHGVNTVPDRWVEGD